MGRPINAKEKAFIIANYGTLTAREMGERLNRSVNTVYWVIKNARNQGRTLATPVRRGRGRGRPPKQPQKRAKRVPTSEQEHAFIRAHAKWPLDRIAYELKRLPQFVAAVLDNAET